jgi:hypothetical protein
MQTGYGYWVTASSQGAGTVRATWSSPPKAGTLAIYAGNPFAGRTDPVRLSPPSGPLATVKVTGRTVGVATGVVPAGTYTAYFYAGGAVGTRQGSITTMRTSCGY